ncbi:MAG: hypothetical protein WCS90_03725 [Bacilli bacterium]
MKKNTDEAAIIRNESPQRIFFCKNESGEDSVSVTRPIGPLKNSSTSADSIRGLQRASSIPLGDSRNGASDRLGSGLIIVKSLVS